MGCGASKPAPDATAPEKTPNPPVPAPATAPTRAPAPQTSVKTAPEAAAALELVPPDDLPAQTTKPRRKRRHSRENEQVAELMQAYHETDAIGRAKELFEESDAGSTGSVSKSDLLAKLKADKQFETLLDLQDKDGAGVLSIMRLRIMLKKLESDGDGPIAWAEFHAAVAQANPEEEVAPALSARAKALFEAAAVEEEAAGSGQAGSVSKPALVAKLKASTQFETLLGLPEVGDKGAEAIAKMRAVLSKLEADGEGSISWADFEAEVNGA